MRCPEAGSSPSCSADWVARGDPTSGPSRSVSDARGVWEDPMAMATADARRAVVAAAVIVEDACGAVSGGIVGTAGG